MANNAATGGLNPSLHRIRERGAQAALLFIHGFSGHLGETWKALSEIVTGDASLDGYDIYSIGYPTSLMPNVPGLWSAEPPLGTLADYLRTTAGLTGLGRYKSLAVAAHSMGGLIVQRACVDDPAFAARLSHLILFGTPSNGLKKARFLFFKRQTQDMASGSPFITDLRARWSEAFSGGAPFKFLAVAGDMDEFVPRSSSIDVFPMEQRAVIPGNHLEMIRPIASDALPYMVFNTFITAGAASCGPLCAARLAVESREFLKAVTLLQEHADSLDEGAFLQYALALEGLGRGGEALAALERRGVRGADALGTLAGRIKRRWLAERRDEDGARALELYVEALDKALGEEDWEQAYYPAINAAFLSRAYARNAAAASDYAARALEYCAKSPPGKWRAATEAEAHMLLGQGDKAPERYAEAIGKKYGASPREIYSMYGQALECAAMLGDAELEGALRRTFGFDANVEERA